MMDAHPRGVSTITAITHDNHDGHETQVHATDTAVGSTGRVFRLQSLHDFLEQSEWLGSGVATV